jgi:hypothetical protein
MVWEEETKIPGLCTDLSFYYRLELLPWNLLPYYYSLLHRLGKDGHEAFFNSPSNLGIAPIVCNSNSNSNRSSHSSIIKAVVVTSVKVLLVILLLQYYRPLIECLIYDLHYENSSHVISLLALFANLSSKQCCHLHFTDIETEAMRS